MILVDSNVWIDYFQGADEPHVERLDILLGAEQLVVGDLILAEILHGIRDEREFNLARKLLREFECVTLGGEAAALQAAQNYCALRRSGITVRKTVDCIIATRCIMDKIALLHNDRDFIPFVEHLGLQEV